MAGHALHDWLHRLELLDQLRNNRCLNPGTLGDSRSPVSVDQLWIFAFFHGHGIDRTDCLLDSAFGFVAFNQFFHVAHAWHQAHHFAHQSGLGDFLHHVFEIVQREIARSHLGFHLFTFFLVDDSVCGFGGSNDVTHLQNPSRHAFRPERLQSIKVLASTNELDRHASDMFDRQQCTTACIAVQLGHDHTIQFQGVVKRTGTVDGVLSGHAVDNQVNLIGADLLIDLLQLGHQLFVDGEATGGVQDDDASAFFFSFLDAVLTNLDRVLVVFLAVDRNVQLLADDVQLIDRRWSLQVGGDQHRLDVLFFQ